MADIAYTLAVGRKAFDHRLAVVCQDREDAVKTLQQFNPKRIIMHRCQAGEKTAVFMFPGIGEHYVGMTAQLYRQEPVFKRELDRCCDILTPILGIDLREILYAEKQRKSPGGIDLRKLVNREAEPLSEEEALLSRTIYAHTSVFTIEIALARLLMSWGIQPHALIGYSLGEYAAACISGVFSLEDALRLVAGRAGLIDAVEQGAMTAVSLPEAQLRPLVNAVDGISIAAVNTPDLCIVSGKPAGIQALETRLNEKKAIYRRLKSFQAFHSPMMQAVRPQLTELFEKVTMNPPAIPYVSNVTGDWITAEQAASTDYWIEHTEHSLRFSEGIDRLLQTSYDFFLEVGPGNSLCGFTAQHPKNRSITGRFVLASLPKESENVPDRSFLLRALGKLWAAGLDIDWSSVYSAQTPHPKRVPLQPYPFERKRYWLEAAAPGEAAPVRTIPGQIAKKENIDQWFYVPTWKQSVQPLVNGQGAAAGSEEKRWLIFLDGSPVGSRLIQQLTIKGTGAGNITAVRVGERFERSAAGEYTVNPGRYDDYAALLEDLGAQDRGFDAIVHLWLLTPAPVVENFLERGVHSLLHLVKAMGGQSLFDRLELWVVGNHLYKIETSDMCSPGKAAVIGPCKVISQEYTNILTRIIDTGLYAYPHAHAAVDGSVRYDDETAEIVDHLLAEFAASRPDRFIAYRGGSRWVQTFEPVKPPTGIGLPAVLREKGVYFITGGLGKIGLAVSSYLAENVQARLVLISRSGLTDRQSDEAKRRRIRQLEEMGAEVLIVQADVSDREQMQQALTQADERFGAVNGVLHAAGTMDPAAFKLVADLEPGDCLAHFNPKIRGTMVLEELFRERDLDFCLLTSSLSPILGGLSLYAYSAANSFMDAFAWHQALVNRKKWLSINWADWQPEEEPAAGDGSAVVGATVSALNISAGEGKETFKRVLTLNRLPQVVISSGDLQRRLNQWINTHPGLGADGGDGETGGTAAQPVVHQRPQLQSIFEPPGSEAEKIVAEIWQELLGLELVGVHDNFFELGGHSLIATKLIARLREIFRIDIPLPTLFDRPTIREVVENITQTWGDRETVEEIAKTYREVQLL